MKQRFSRRLVLRGLGGLGIGLPLLQFQNALAATPQVAKRFIVFFEHGGTLSNNAGDKKYSGNGAENGVDAWAPSTFGEALDPGPIHQPLAAHTDSLLLLRGIDNKAGRRQGSYGGNHYTANCTAMTAADVTPFDLSGKFENGDLRSKGRSLDQELADRLNIRHPVRIPCVSLGIWGHNYGTPFYRKSLEQLWGEESPSKAWTSTLSGVTPSGSQPDPAVLRAQALKKSVLDGTGESLKLFQNRLSSQDRQTVEAHLEHIRSLELRLSKESVPLSAVCNPPKNSGLTDGAAYPAYGNAQVDIMLAALRCGLTNVCTLNIGDMLTTFLNPLYRTDLGHSLDHAAREVGKTGTEANRYNDWYQTMLDNRKWRMSLLARFLDGLKATPEGDGTMLDNSVILWTSEFSFGANHSSADVPVLLAGKGGGAFRTGRHIDFNTEAAANPATLKYKTNKSTHNLFTSILNAFGYPDTHFGNAMADYQGPLPGLG